VADTPGTARPVPAVWEDDRTATGTRRGSAVTDVRQQPPAVTDVRQQPPAVTDVRQQPPAVTDVRQGPSAVTAVRKEAGR
jgi:hypothetical protein